MPPSVFISYSHDTDAHKDRVLELARTLLKAGWDVRLDRYSGHPAEGWPRWMARQIREAERVVCVCTPTYRRRFDGEETTGGLGVSWEGHLITADLYSARGGASRYLPAFIDSDLDVPLALRPRAVAFDRVAADLGCAGEPRPEPPLRGGADGPPRYAPVRALFRPLRERQGQYAPSDLLRPEFGVIRHVVRPGVDDALDAWCVGGGIRVRLLTGGGGTGKTRSALELARRRQNEGWRVGPLLEDAGVSDEALECLLDDPIPLLLIVDYAELRTPQVARVLNHLDRAAETARNPLVVRVLLLARSKGRWWENLAEAAECLEAYSDGTEWKVPALDVEDFGRHAARQYATLLKRSLPAVVPEDGATPLERQVNALLAVYGDAARGLDALLRHEDKFILNAATRTVGRASLLSGAIAEILPSVVALTTLVGGLPPGEVEAWLEAVPALAQLPGPERLAIARVLRAIYPDDAGGIAPLRPDRIGERLVFREVREDAEVGLLTLAVDRERVSHTLTVLARLAQSGPPGVRSEEAGLLRRLFAQRLAGTARAAVDVAIQTGDPIGRVLAAELDRNPNLEVLREVEAALPSRTVALRELGEVCSRQLARFETEPRVRARHLNHLSTRLADLGRWEDALASIEEAIEIYRALAKSRPDAFLPNLASALGNLSPILTHLRRPEDALAASQEAVEVYRTLVRVRPDAFLPDLATALNNLSTALTALGRPKDALEASREAVGIYRVIAKDRPDSFLPNMATAVNNLSARLADLGRREDALVASQEATEGWRALAKARPDAFLPNLASALGNLSPCLASVGRREDALAAAEEAVAVYRVLAQTRPDPFLPGLAIGLNNLSNRLADLGRKEDALAAVEESVGVHRALPKPGSYAPTADLAKALQNLSTRLADLGRRGDALEAVHESVGIYRDLARIRPGALLPDLAMGLSNLSNRLAEVGSPEAALEAVQESVELYQAFTKVAPDAALPGLAMALNNLSNRLGELGRREDALKAANEAVGVYRALADTRPDVFLPNLAMGLNNLSNRLSDFGRREDALAAIREAVGVRRALAKTRPDVFLPNLANSLTNLSSRFADLGRRERALEAIQEAVDICRALASARPEAFLPNLATSLWMRAKLATGVADLEGVRAGGESVALFRRLAVRWPEAFAGRLRGSIQTYIKACACAGVVPDARLLESGVVTT